MESRVPSDTEWRELEKKYQNDYPHFEEAACLLKNTIQRVIDKIADSRLVRVQVRGSRIKDFDSLRLKAARNNWTPQDAIWQCSDIVGARVVCNNRDDIYRFAELFCEYISIESMEKQDFVTEPQSSGYRALHLHFRIEIYIAPFQLYRVPCELQIRTLLQDSWAELVHEDIYKKGATLPEDLSSRAQDLATLLAAADEIAARIRARASHQSVPVQSQPRLDELSEDGLRYVFANVFGRNPADYAVQAAKNLCEKLELNALTKLGTVLADQNFGEELAKAYARSIGHPAKVPYEELFMVAPYAAAGKTKLAVKAIQKEAQKERDYAEGIWRSEALSDLPDTIEGLLSLFENPPKDGDFLYDVNRWAEALGASHECGCSETIIDANSLAWSIIEGYELLEKEAENVVERIERAVADNGAEIGYWRNPSMCSHCGESFFRDD